MSVGYADEARTIAVWNVPTYMARCNRCEWMADPASTSGEATRRGLAHADECPGRKPRKAST